MGLSTGGWIYKDVDAAGATVLGEEGRGFYVLMDGFNAARILVAAACLGGAEKALEISGEYTAQRQTFGKPLGKWEGISFEMADDWMQLDCSSWTCSAPPGCTATSRRTRARSVARTSTASSPPASVSRRRSTHDIARHGMMYHGAFGYTRETPLEMLLRGVMSYEVGAEGGLNDHARHHRPRHLGRHAQPV